MANPFDLPAELQSLIEKREQADRREGADEQGAAEPPPVAGERRVAPRRADDRPAD